MPWTRVDGTTLFHREEGTGPLAVFIHGFPLDHTMWSDQLHGLAHVRRCVALDLRGYGRSGPVRRPVATMELLAADVAALIESSGESGADVVGLSMGGYVALALADHFPQKIRSLTLMDTRATADTAEARRSRDAMIARLLDEGKATVMSEMAHSLLGDSPSPRAVARFRSMAEAVTYSTLVASLHGMRRRPDRTGVLQRLEVPILVVGGDQDRLIDVEETLRLAAAAPGARTSIIRDAGHLPPIEQPDQVNEVLIEHLEGRKVVWWNKKS